MADDTDIVVDDNPEVRPPDVVHLPEVVDDDDDRNGGDEEGDDEKEEFALYPKDIESAAEKLGVRMDAWDYKHICKIGRFCQKKNPREFALGYAVLMLERMRDTDEILGNCVQSALKDGNVVYTISGKPIGAEEALRFFECQVKRADVSKKMLEFILSVAPESGGKKGGKKHMSAFPTNFKVPTAPFKPSTLIPSHPRN